MKKATTNILLTFAYLMFQITLNPVYSQKQLQLNLSVSPYGFALNKTTVDFVQLGQRINTYLTSQYITFGVSDLFKENYIFGLETSLQKSSFTGNSTNLFPEEPLDEFELQNSEFTINSLSRRFGIRFYYLFLNESSFTPIIGGSIHHQKDFRWIENGIANYIVANTGETKTENYQVNTKITRSYAYYDLRFGTSYKINSKLSLSVVMEVSAGLFSNNLFSGIEQPVHKIEVALPITISFSL